MKRAGLLALTAMALSACQYGLDLSVDPAAKGQTVTVSNPDGTPCVDYETEEPGEVDVVVMVITSLVDVSNAMAQAMDTGDASHLEPFVDEGTTDEEGYFSVDVTAPSTPGQHLVLVACDASLEMIEEDVEELRIEASSLRDDVDPEALYLVLSMLFGSENTIFDILDVTQDPLTIAVDKDEIEAGEQVVATFNRCQAHNDFDLPSIMAAEMALAEAGDEPDPEELASDYPDLDVFVDGVLVTTIEGTERYPTGTVDVPLTLTEVGEHEISGVCRYQTFELLEEYFEMVPQTYGAELQAQAVEYPYPPADEEAPVVWNEAATNPASAVVDVVAADTGAGTVTPPAANPPAAAPVVAAPRYTG
jgi:hypothetical protein